MEDKDQYNHIKTEIGVSPIKYNVAFSSINSRGGLGELNLFVLKELGYDNSVIEGIDVSKGYYLLNNGRNKPILFIVTVGYKEFSGITLQRNLRAALNDHESFLESKNIWVPLMATGAGGLEFVDSYDTTVGILKNYTRINFTIAVPNSNKGKEFIQNFRADNYSKGDTGKDFVENLIEKFNRKLFLVGSTWGKNDQIDRFIQESIWENGYDDRYIEIVNSIKKGDLLLMKSTFARNNKSILRIKAYGTCIRNLNDGKAIEVEWVRLDDQLDIDDLGYYRDTIVEPSRIDTGIIIENLLREFPNMEIDIDNKRRKNNSDLEFNEQYKVHRYVRDVLNAEYSINLVIESARVVDGEGIRLDLSDDKAKYYVSLFKKDDFLNLPFEAMGDSNHQDDNIINNIYLEVRKSFNILKLSNSLDKLFVFFDDTFSEQDINVARQWNYDGDNEIIQIITQEEIDLIAIKHGIVWMDYLNNEASNSTNEDFSKDNSKDKIPFHLDQVVDEDKLGREPVAKAFVDLLKEDIFTSKLNHSFMVHLQGKWGSGKSSFLNFIKQNLNSDIEKWIIVDYNAWQNQHINPPWWSLINQIYLQSKEQFYLIGIRKSLHLRRKEIFRRIWRYSGWQKILAFVFFILFVLCIIYFGNDILELFSASGEDSENEFLNQLGDFGKLILTSMTLLTSLYGFAKFITFPFFINSSKDAESFVLRASDPMNQVKRHFNDLVDDINSFKTKQQLAIFIDDIDRCDKENIVCLLEGIQTLFKEKRVLYIIAGDKDWISTSFGNTYKEFTTEGVDKKQLGEFFIQKAFQLSFRLPNISEESKQNYWNHILGMKSLDETKKVKSLEELSQEEQSEIKSVLAKSKSQLTDPEFVKDFQEKYNLSGDTASNIVIEEKNKDTEELRHLLQDYHKYIDTNPRSIIRLANNYTMARSILMAERVHFNEHVLFRWLIIEDLCPKVLPLVPSVIEIDQFEEVINENNDIVKRNNCIKLFRGEEEFMQGEITIQDIKTIKGL